MTNRQIETDRLRLRPLGRDDVDALHRLLTEPGVREYLCDGEVYPRERIASFVETSIASFEAHGCGLWGVMLKDADRLIGFCGFWFVHEPPRLELLYGLGENHWHQGFATEVATEMIRYGFDTLSLERVEASTDAPNAASVAVMERIGMTFWKREITNGLDTIYYAITRAWGRSWSLQRSPPNACCSGPRPAGRCAAWVSAFRSGEACWQRSWSARCSCL
jgi:[ribosomal protein S5]-alanine N-acetyltransferase